jgi:transketolase
VWEGFLVAQALGLDNLVAVVDRNQFQANIRTEELVPLEPLGDKLAAFGWGVRRLDGHSFAALEEGFASLPILAGKPSMVIADTIRGKGLPSIQERADRWFVNFTRDEVAMLIEELHGNAKATLTSDTLMVR